MQQKTTKTHPFGICKKCGKWYNTFMGSMAHGAGNCANMVDRKEEFSAWQEYEAAHKEV